MADHYLEINIATNSNEKNDDVEFMNEVIFEIQNAINEARMRMKTKPSLNFISVKKY